MTRTPRTVSRRAHRLVGGAALALAVAACGQGSGDLSDVAATVDGEEITVEELEPIADQIEAQGAGQGDPFTTALASEVQNAALGAFLDDAGIEATEEEIDEVFAEVAEQQGIEVEDFIAQQVDSGVTEEELRDRASFQVRFGKYREQLQEEVDVPEEEVRALYDERKDLLGEAQVSHILVETEEEAAAAQERLDGGEDFADVASDVSIDPGSGAEGGALPPAPLTTYVPEFAEAAAEAPIGEVVGPVQTQFGFHLIRVDERSEPSFEDVEEELRAEVIGADFEAQLLEEVKAGLAEIDIEVNSRFGRWDPDAGEIGDVVPDGPLEDGDDAPADAPEGSEAPVEPSEDQE